MSSFVTFACRVLVWMLFVSAALGPAAIAQAVSGASQNQAIGIADSGTALPAADDPDGTASSVPDPWEILPGVFGGASSTAVPLPIPKSRKWDWKASTVQTLEFTLVNHLFRLAMDPSLRNQLLHKPFIHDWFVSYGGYNLKRWGDGDDFMVNDVGHPLQGAVTSRIFLQNNPRSFVPISKNRDYWVPWAQSMIWAAAWQVQWKVGPLSETSLGNAGGWMYVPDCGGQRSCLNNPKYPKSPTNNTGLTDWIVTPLVGGAWVLAEDTLERYVVAPVAREHRILGGRILRACLEPSRDFAALFAGTVPWEMANAEDNFIPHNHPKPLKLDADPEVFVPRWEIGTQYTNISLPVLKAGCGTGCRENISGFGFNLDHHFTRQIAFDSTVNLLPGQDGASGMTQGMFGLKVGESFKHWGLYAKVRPGFIYYENAYPGGGSTSPTNLTRFAWDLGGILELYTSGQGTLRLDAGTTVVRYLADAPDQHTSQIGSLLSTQYYVNQGNLQISAGYVHRF